MAVTLSRPSQNPAGPLSLTRHTGPMQAETLRWVLLSVMILLCAAVWTAVILVALHVSRIVLETLDMIVELAAITP